MRPEELGPFIAGKLLRPELNAWDEAPKSYDFQINHHTEGFSDEALRLIIKEFCKNNNDVGKLDKYLHMPMRFDGVEYLLCLDHNPRISFIQGTLTRM